MKPLCVNLQAPHAQKKKHIPPLLRPNTPSTQKHSQTSTTRNIENDTRTALGPVLRQSASDSDLRLWCLLLQLLRLLLLQCLLLLLQWCPLSRLGHWPRHLPPAGGRRHRRRLGHGRGAVRQRCCARHRGMLHGRCRRRHGHRSLPRLPRLHLPRQHLPLRCNGVMHGGSRVWLINLISPFYKLETCATPLMQPRREWWPFAPSNNVGGKCKIRGQ